LTYIRESRRPMCCNPIQHRRESVRLVGGLVVGSQLREEYSVTCIICHNEWSETLWTPIVDETAALVQ
jgi:hypothetical protein